MKIWTLVNIPNLREPIKSTEFLHNEKFMAPGSLCVKIEERFPAQPAMPQAHPDLSAQPSHQRNYKFVAELSSMDRDLYLMAYRNAMAEDTQKRLDGRNQVIRQEQERADIKRITSEHDSQIFGLTRAWLKRLNMHDKFHKLGIKTMDDFKLFVENLQRKRNDQAIVQEKLFLRQGNVDPSHLPAMVAWNRISGKDEDLIRLKLHMEHNEKSALLNMRHALAEQHAALVMAQWNTNQQMMRDWKQHLDNTSRVTDELLNRSGKIKKIG